MPAHLHKLDMYYNCSLCRVAGGPQRPPPPPNHACRTLLTLRLLSPSSLPNLAPPSPIPPCACHRNPPPLTRPTPRPTPAGPDGRAPADPAHPVQRAQAPPSLSKRQPEKTVRGPQESSTAASPPRAQAVQGAPTRAARVGFPLLPPILANVVDPLPAVQGCPPGFGPPLLLGPRCCPPPAGPGCQARVRCVLLLPTPSLLGYQE